MRTALAEVEMFACGPTPMLMAAAQVARRFGVPCQVSLEEFMACAVGGCAGCAVPVVTDARARDEARVRGRAGVRRERGVSAGGVRLLTLRGGREGLRAEAHATIAGS